MPGERCPRVAQRSSLPVDGVPLLVSVRCGDGLPRDRSARAKVGGEQREQVERDYGVAAGWQPDKRTSARPALR